MSEPGSKNRSSCLIAAVIIALLIISIFFAIRNPGPPGDGGDPYDYRDEAWPPR